VTTRPNPIAAAISYLGVVGPGEASDGYGQRNAWMVDPFGHRWGLNSPIRAR
jgi:hypothetical protein